VPVRPHRFGFVAEEEADTFILRDAVAAEEVVAVFVADGDADAFVAAQLVVLEPAVLHAPTHVEAVAAVADRPALADERPGRSAAWVQAEAGVVLGEAFVYGNGARYLKADAVAVGVAHGAVADGHFGALEEVDAPVPAAVHRLARGLAARAFDDYVLDRRVFHVPASDGRKT